MPQFTSHTFLFNTTVYMSILHIIKRAISVIGYGLQLFYHISTTVHYFSNIMNLALGSTLIQSY